MPVYQITTEKTDPRVESVIASNYAGQNYQWGDRVWFLHSSDTTQEVAAKLGVPVSQDAKKPENMDRVIVMRLAPAYWGWAQSELWEWLKAAFQKDSV